MGLTCYPRQNKSGLMSELEDLIQEQQKELKLGRFQRPEQNTVPLEEMYPFLSAEGPMPPSYRKIQWPECAIHGRSRMMPGSPRSYYRFKCGSCQVEATYRWREKNRDTYNAYRRRYQREWYKKNPEWVAARNARRRQKYAEKRGRT